MTRDEYLELKKNEELYDITDFTIGEHVMYEKLLRTFGLYVYLQLDDRDSPRFDGVVKYVSAEPDNNIVKQIEKELGYICCYYQPYTALEEYLYGI